MVRELAGDYAEAAQYYLAAARIDSSYADLLFRLGRYYWAMGQYDEARERFIEARELDTLRFRADNRINQIIRSIAEGKEAEGIHFADTAGALARSSPHHVPGREFFYEHVHFTYAGSYVVARTLFEQVESMLPDRIRNGMHKDPVLSEEQCATYLAYTGWDRYVIARRVLEEFVVGPPFTNQLYHDQRIRGLNKLINELSVHARPPALRDSVAQYERALQQRPSDWRLLLKYGECLVMGSQDYVTATEQLRKLVRHFPYFRFYVLLGELLQARGMPREATAVFRKSIQQKPSFRGHMGLAKTLHGQRELEGAIEHYTEAVKLRPQGSLPAYTELARALGELGQDRKAIETLRAAIDLFSEGKTARCHYLLGRLLGQQGQTEQAKAEMREALRLQPDRNHPDHKLFQDALERLGGERTLQSDQ